MIFGTPGSKARTASTHFATLSARRSLR
jgi:hypothetical protein